MSASYRSIVLLAVLLLLVGGIANAQITTTGSGNWSSTTADAPWPGGVVPTSANDVVIATGHTVTIDIVNATCRDLSVSGNLYFGAASGLGITVNGNTVVNAAARFRMASATPTSGQAFQQIELKKSLTVVSTGTFDMRQASSAIGAVGRVLFSGPDTSIISLSLTTFGSSNEEFNSVEINKTGTGRVIIASGTVFQNNNSTNMGDTLVLTSGIIETGANRWVTQRTGGAAVVGGSSTSYVYGTLGRGVSNGGSQVELFYPIGDATTYRPISVHCDGPANATGHYVWANVVKSDANTGTSVLNNGITKLSKIRYAAVGYVKSTSAASMPIDRIEMSYGSDDGVSSGNTDLRVCYSTDARATWNAFTDDTLHVTSLVSPPTTISSDTLLVALNVADGATIYAALGTVNSTTNPLEGTGTGVDVTDAIPTEVTLGQNYPNPFNPSTKISYGLPANGYVSLAIFNLLGQRVATLVDGIKAAGTHTALWNGRDASGRIVPSGVYIYRMEGGGMSQAKRMILMK